MPFVHFHASTDVGNVRRANEDMYVIFPDVAVKLPPSADIASHRSLIAIFDGHGGTRAAAFLQQNILSYFTDDEHYGIDTKKALESTMRRLEKAFLHHARGREKHDRGVITDGSTAIVVVFEIIHVDPDDNKDSSTAMTKATMRMTAANVGDSRAIVIHHLRERSSSSYSILPLSFDHTPKRRDEAARIYEHGGFIAYTNKFCRQRTFESFSAPSIYQRVRRPPSID